MILRERKIKLLLLEAVVHRLESSSPMRCGNGGRDLMIEGHSTGARAQFAQPDQVESGQVLMIEKECDIPKSLLRER